MIRTIAILGETEGFSQNLLELLVGQDIRLLFVAEDEEKKSKLKAESEFLKPFVEVDFTSCEIEGCWEADIILLYKLDASLLPVIKKIREVAIQKPVLVISGDEKRSEKVDIKNLLSKSNVVEIQVTQTEKEYSNINVNLDKQMNFEVK